MRCLQKLPAWINYSILLVGSQFIDACGQPSKSNTGATYNTKVSHQTSISQPKGLKIIFQASPSAGPGEAVSVQGAFSAQATAWLRPAATPEASPRQLPILGQSATQLTAQLPADLPLDCYQLWVREPGGQPSAPVSLNRALGLQVDADEVAPGRPLRLYGRNLSLSGYSPSVEFVEAASGASAGLATLDPSQSDAYSLLLTAPAGLQPGTSYQLRLSNGAGGRAGTSLAEVSVRARATGVDYFGLQVGWASVFDFYATRYNVVDDTRLPQRAKADGVNNDQPALQAALNYVSQRGGGVVYLPAGTYKLVYTSTAALAIPDNVVVQGAGMDRTLLRYGYGPAPAMGYAIGLAGRQRLGLCELSLENVNEQGRWEHNLTSYPARTGQRYVFLKNVRWRYAGEALTIVQPTEQVLVQGCEFTSRYNPQSQYQQGPLTVSHARQWVLRGNRFEHQVWQTGFNKDCEQLVFEGNTFIRDASVQRLAQPPSVETRTLSINYAKNVVLRGNTFQTSNGPALPHNDGETILNESGGPSHQDADFGYVSSASSTSLTAAQARWPQLTSGAIVVIVGGKGQGQWRRVVGNSARSLTLDQAWDVVPDASSRYSITGWSAENWLVQDNLLQNNRAGLELWGCSSWQVAIVGNHLVNNSGILLRPGQQSVRGIRAFSVMYNTQVVNNVVEDIAGPTNTGTPAYIGLLPFQFVDLQTLGTCAVGVEFRGNTVRGRPSYKWGIFNNNELGTEGFYNYLLRQFEGTNGDTPVTMGTLFDNNTAIDCSHAFYLNSGAYNTVLHRNKLQSTPHLLDDRPVLGSNHSAVNTVVTTSLATIPNTKSQQVAPNKKPRQ
jgi:hypothetical protein